MNASRLIILGVAAIAASGAGYIAKNMLTAPPPEVIVDSGPSTPQVALTEVLVLAEDLPLGATIDSQLRWQSWPVDANWRPRSTAPADPV